MLVREVDDGERTLDSLPGDASRQAVEGAQVATPSQVDVWIGLDLGKSEHFADVLDDDGERLFARAVANDQVDLENLLGRAARHGTPGLVTGQSGEIAQLALAVADRRGTPVAYVPGLVMPPAADSYPGEDRPQRRLTYSVTSPQLPAWIVIYPDPTRDRWRHSIMGPATGFACGDLDLPTATDPDQVRQAARAMLRQLGHDLYHADLTITWHPPDRNGRISGDIHPAAKPA